MSMNRREFLKSSGVAAAGVIIAPLILQSAQSPLQASETPKKFNPNDYAERILKGDRTTLDEAPGIPPRAMNQVGERLYIKIVLENYPKTPKGIKTFQDFMTLSCVPWDMCESVCRRICRSRNEAEHLKWILGHQKLRARILASFNNQEKDPREAVGEMGDKGYHGFKNKYRWSNRFPKRGIPFNEPKYWNETLNCPAFSTERAKEALG